MRSLYRKRHVSCSSALLVLLCAFFSTAAAPFDASSEGRNETDERSLFQVSTLDALSLGLYQGVYAIGRLKEHGDFGLGTFEGIDGEMTVVDRHFYHFRSDGTLTEEGNTTKVPFAVLTEFKPQLRFTVRDKSLNEMGKYIDQFLPSPNFFYAIRIHGLFTHLTTRAIPKLFPPYPPLTEAVQQEIIFPYENVEGQIAAFRCPAFVKGLNQVGYHYHFISDDKTIGGHCLDFVTGPVTVEVEILRENSVWLPDTPAFRNAPLPVSQ